MAAFYLFKNHIGCGNEPANDSQAALSIRLVRQYLRQQSATRAKGHQPSSHRSRDAKARPKPGPFPEEPYSSNLHQNPFWTTVKSDESKKYSTVLRQPWRLADHLIMEKTDILRITGKSSSSTNKKPELVLESKEATTTKIIYK